MTKRKNKYAQEETRIRVAEYLRNKMGTQSEAAEIFGITQRAVNKIWATYKLKGKRGLQAKKRGRPAGAYKLSEDQMKHLRKAIKDKVPDQLKLPFGLWTRQAVQQLIENTYDVTLSRWQVGRYLKAWGFTPQKPISKAIEQKPHQVRAWMKDHYPRIKQKAKEENGIIYFGDETGMRSDHQAGRSYAPKGKTPVIPKTGKGFSVNMISAISNRGHLQFMVLKGRFNGEVFLDFLKRMTRYSRKKIFFITDGHPSHKTIKVMQWVKENQSKIELFFLPSYSPELNPQEYLNQDVKTNAVGKQRSINKEQLVNRVSTFMNSKKKNKAKVMKYFHHKHVKYAA
jgi:transposase